MPPPDPPGSLIDLFLEWAERIPHAPAVIDGELLLSYRALEFASRRAALDFSAAGWRPGDVVAAAFGTMPQAQAIVAILALGRAGITLLPLSAHEAASGEVAALLRGFGAVALLAASPTAGEPGVPVRLIDPAWLAADAPAPQAFAGPALRDLRLMIGRSSGTTGAPKAFAITHAQEVARMALHPAPLQISPDDRLATLSGLGFPTGIRCALRGPATGATLVAMPHKADPEAILGHIDRCAVSYLFASPVHLPSLLRTAGTQAPRLPRLRVLSLNGSVLSPALLAQTRAGLTPNIHIVYGTNEAGNVTGATPGMLARHPTTVGQVFPGIAMELRDAAGHPLPPGQPGRVWVRSAGQAGGYMAATDVDAARFRDGWFDTGDIAGIDAEGLVFLKGRADEIMNFDGMLVAPREIEAAFEGHPLVAEVVAFAMPSAVRQDLPCIAVVARGARDSEALMAHGRQRLGAKCPRAVLYVTEMPRNAAGKELRRELAALAARQRPG